MLFTQRDDLHYSYSLIKCTQFINYLSSRFSDSRHDPHLVADYWILKDCFVDALSPIAYILLPVAIICDCLCKNQPSSH